MKNMKAKTIAYIIIIMMLITVSAYSIVKTSATHIKSKELTDSVDGVTDQFIKERITKPLYYFSFLRIRPEVNYRITKKDSKAGFIYGEAYKVEYNYKTKEREEINKYNFRVNVGKDVAEIQNSDKEYIDAEKWLSSNRGRD
ncbi:MAG: hypothetical protein WBP45_06575 [Daejeonella sp.]